MAAAIMASAAALGLFRILNFLATPRRGFIITVFRSLHKELGVLVVAERCVGFTAKIGGGATEISELYDIIIVWVIDLLRIGCRGSTKDPHGVQDDPKTY
jgi:hypothetical protein